MVYDHISPVINVIFPHGDTNGNCLSSEKRLQDCVILKVTEKEIWETFPEPSSKVRSRQWVKLNIKQALMQKVLMN